MEYLAKIAIKLLNLVKRIIELILYLSISLNSIITVNFATLTGCNRKEGVLSVEVKGLCLWTLKNKRKITKIIDYS